MKHIKLKQILSFLVCSGIAMGLAACSSQPDIKHCGDPNKVRLNIL